MSHLEDTVRTCPPLGVSPPPSKKSTAVAFLSPPLRIRPSILDECGHSSSSAAEKKHRKRGGKGHTRQPSACFPNGSAAETGANVPCNKDAAFNIASLLATAKAASLTDEVPLKGIILANRRSVFHKTRMCPRQRNRSCPLGDSCTFAHSEQELRPPPVLDRTRLCPSVLTSGAPCPRAHGEQCRFAHSKAEIRHTANMFKTNMCLKWNRGKCKAGEDCNHAHGEDELRFYRLLAHANGSRDFRSEAEAGALRALRGAADQSKGGQQRLQALLLQAVGQSGKDGEPPSRRKGRRGGNPSSLGQRKPMPNTNALKLSQAGRGNVPVSSPLSSSDDDQQEQEPAKFCSDAAIGPEFFRRLSASGTRGFTTGGDPGGAASRGEDFFKLLIGLAPHAPELVLSVLAQHLAEGLSLSNSQQTQQCLASALAGSGKQKFNVPFSKQLGSSAADNSSTGSSPCGPVYPPGITVRDNPATHEGDRGGKGVVQGPLTFGPRSTVTPLDACSENEYAEERAALYALRKRAGVFEGGSASPVFLPSALGGGLGSAGMGLCLNSRVSPGQNAGSGTPDSSSTCASVEESADRLGSLLKISTLLDDETRQGSLSPSLPAALTPPDPVELGRSSHGRAGVGPMVEGSPGCKKRVTPPYLVTGEEVEKYVDRGDAGGAFDSVASAMDPVQSESLASLYRVLNGKDENIFCQEGRQAVPPFFFPSIPPEETAARPAGEPQEGSESGQSFIESSGSRGDGHAQEGGGAEGGVTLQDAVTLLQSLGLVDGGRRNTRPGGSNRRSYGQSRVEDFFL